MYFRPLLLSDYYFDFLKINSVFSDLTDSRCNYSTYYDFKETWFSITQNKNHKIFLLIGKNNEILGTGTIIFEKKIIHNSYCAHIENIIVSPKYKSNGFGSKIINYLIDYANNKDCYKIVLNCTKELESFYQKFNFFNPNNNIQMEIRLK